MASEPAPANPDVDVAADTPDAPDTNLGDLPSVSNPDVDISDGDNSNDDSPETSTSDTESDNGSDIESGGGYVVEDRIGGGDIEGEPKDERGGYVHEPSDTGGTVTIVTEDYEGPIHGSPKNSASSNNIPIPDEAVTTDHSSTDDSNTGPTFDSRITGSPSLTGLMSGGGSGGSSGVGSGGSSGGGSYDGGSSFTRGGVGVV